MIILPNYDKEEIGTFAERLRNAFESHFFKVDGQKEKVTISIGYAIWPFNGNSYNEVISVANEAKLKAKKNGGNIIEG